MVSLQLMPYTHWDGGCPLCVCPLASVMGHHHSGGGMWQVVENRFGELPELAPFPLFLPSLDSARECGEEEVNSDLPALFSFQ